MSSGSARLVKAGFFKSGDKKKEFESLAKQEGKKPEELIAEWEKKSPDKFADFADSDELEYTKDQMLIVDYPKPDRKWFLIYETPNEGIEQMYYRLLALLFDLGFVKTYKITDVFTGSEQSSFWGQGAQRLGLQQDKVMTFLATIGKLMKDLFQLVRELRILDERIGYYEGVKKGHAASDITLKGLWVDLVDGVGAGGQKSSVNIFLMAQQLNFVTLPDYFFKTFVKMAPDEETAKKSPKMYDEDAVDDSVTRLEVNEKVKEVLKRKLYAYVRWRRETYREIVGRKKFTLHYLRQHFLIIKMYMNWIKPYLKHIERLQGEGARLDAPELISAFEAAMLEIEVLCLQSLPNVKGVYACALLNIEYRTKPTMPFSQEYAHKGPLHVGESRITWRSYGWSEEQVKNYLFMKDVEDLELIASIDASLKEAMESLGESLKKYLEESEGKKEPEKKPPKPATIWQPFFEIAKGFKELSGLFSLAGIWKPGAKKDSETQKANIESAQKKARAMTWLSYKFFKKGSGLAGF